MLIETLLISLIVGKIRGGKIKNLINIPIDGWVFIIVGFLISYLSVFLISRGNQLLYEGLVYIQSISSILIIIGILYKVVGFDRIVLAFGFLLNTIPIALNNGKMPVDGNALIELGLNTQFMLLKDNLIVTHSLIDTSTKMSFLSDVISLPYIFPKVSSIGDLFISLGIFLIIQKNIKIYQSLQ
jgi:hypothetical protein